MRVNNQRAVADSGDTLINLTLHYTALGWLFFQELFVDLIDPKSANGYITGMILLGMVFALAPHHRFGER